MRKAYKIILMVISILLIGSIIIGTSYSIWVKTAIQKEQNIVNSSCFDISNVSRFNMQITESNIKNKPLVLTTTQEPMGV